MACPTSSSWSGIHWLGQKMTKSCRFVWTLFFCLGCFVFVCLLNNNHKICTWQQAEIQRNCFQLFKKKCHRMPAMSMCCLSPTLAKQETCFKKQGEVYTEYTQNNWIPLSDQLNGKFQPQCCQGWSITLVVTSFNLTLRSIPDRLLPQIFRTLSYNFSVLFTRYWCMPEEIDSNPCKPVFCSSVFATKQV